jgi:hypothetical protein
LVERRSGIKQTQQVYYKVVILSRS